MTDAGGFIEVQGTAEGAPFTNEQLSSMLGLAEQGLKALFTAQQEALRETL